MKPLHHFVVQLDKKFNDEVKISEDTTLKIVTKFDEFTNRVNVGKIVAAPASYKNEKLVGQSLYFHHHVVMEQKYDIGENLFLVTYEPNGGYANHAIAIEDEDGNITMLGDWCFVLPNAEPEEETSASGIILSIKKEPELEGELLAMPKDSEWIGTELGDVVGYTKNSDYSMELSDGTKVYRMRISELVYAKKD